MAQNGSNQDFTNESDGFTLAGGSTKRALNVSGGDVDIEGAGSNVYTFPPSTSELATIDLAQTFAEDQTFDKDIIINTAGKGLNIKEGSNARMGTATLSSGTVTVNTTAVTANSRIFLTVNGGTLTNVGAVYVSARSAGTSFTISSLNALDASDVAWIIFEPV